MQPIYHHPSEITTTRSETAEGFLQQSMRQFELASPFISTIIEAQRKLAYIGPDLENLLQAAERRSRDYRNPHRGTGADRESQKCYWFRRNKKTLAKTHYSKKTRPPRTGYNRQYSVPIRAEFWRSTWRRQAQRYG